MNLQGIGSSNSALSLWFSQKYSFPGGAGWCLAEPRNYSLWLPPLSDHFLPFQKSYELLECLMGSEDAFILLARILPLTRLFSTMPRACWVDCRLFFQFWLANICVAFLLEQYPFPLCLLCHPFCRYAYVPKGTTPCFLKGLENIYQIALLFPSVFTTACSSFWWITRRWQF